MNEMPYIDDFVQLDKVVKEEFEKVRYRKITGEEGKLKVVYYKPDIDFTRQTSNPEISLRRTTPYVDTYRLGDDITPMKVDCEYLPNGVLKSYTEVPAPIPMIVEYTATLRYTKQSDGAMINSAIIPKFIRGGEFVIKDIAYPFTFQSSGAVATQYRDVGKVKDEEREYIEVYRIKVLVWLNPYVERDEDGKIIGERVSTVLTMGLRVGMMDRNKRKEDYYGENSSTD